MTNYLAAVGALAPDTAWMDWVLNAQRIDFVPESGMKVVASGGVKSIEDIKALLPYEKDGIEGVIVGKSIYTGSLDLSEAIKVASGAEE